MLEFKHEKLGVSFSLPEDITQAELEQYEVFFHGVLAKSERRSDAVLWRGAIEGAWQAGWIRDAEGVPKTTEEIQATKPAVNNFIATEIALWLMELKTVPPN